MDNDTEPQMNQTAHKSMTFPAAPLRRDNAEDGNRDGDIAQSATAPINERDAPYEGGMHDMPPSQRPRTEQAPPVIDLDGIALCLVWGDQGQSTSCLSMFAPRDFPGALRVHHYSYKSLRGWIKDKSGIAEDQPVAIWFAEGLRHVRDEHDLGFLLSSLQTGVCTPLSQAAYGNHLIIGRSVAELAMEKEEVAKTAQFQVQDYVAPDGKLYGGVMSRNAGTEDPLRGPQQQPVANDNGRQAYFSNDEGSRTISNKSHFDSCSAEPGGYTKTPTPSHPICVDGRLSMPLEAFLEGTVRVLREDHGGMSTQQCDFLKGAIRDDVRKLRELILQWIEVQERFPMIQKKLKYCLRDTRKARTADAIDKMVQRVLAVAGGLDARIIEMPMEETRELVRLIVARIMGTPRHAHAG